MQLGAAQSHNCLQDGLQADSIADVWYKRRKAKNRY